MCDCVAGRANMSSNTQVRAVLVVLALVACSSLLVVGTVAVRHRGRHSVDRRSARTAAVCEAVAALDVDVSASCEVCAGLPDDLVVACCRWCVADDKITSVQSDVDDRLMAADKRVKFFLGKRPKYFLGK